MALPDTAIPTAFSAKTGQATGSVHHPPSAEQASVRENGTTKGEPFSFRKRRSRVDWRSVASVDIDRIVRNMDLTSLERNILNVAFCNLELEDLESLDPNYLKLFRLSQLIIECLLYSQRFLQSTNEETTERANIAEQTLKHLQSEQNVLKQKLEVVRKDNRRRKKTIASLQGLLSAHSDGYRKCSECGKTYLSEAYLHSHLQRRHPHMAVALVTTQSAKAHARVEEESAARQLAEGQLAQVQRSLEHMEQRLKQTEAQLRAEMAEREVTLLRQRDEEVEEIRRTERDRQQEQLQTLLRPLEQQVRQLQQAKLEAEEVAANARAEVAQAHRSNLGEIEDDDGGEVRGRSARASALHRQEVEALSRQLEEERRRNDKERHRNQESIDELKMGLVTQLQQQQEKQERLWKKKMKHMEKLREQELAEATSRLSAMQSSLTSSTDAERLALAQERQQIQLQLQQLNEMSAVQTRKVTEQQQYLAQLERMAPSASQPPLVGSRLTAQRSSGQAMNLNSTAQSTNFQSTQSDMMAVEELSDETFTSSGEDMVAEDVADGFRQPIASKPLSEHAQVTMATTSTRPSRPAAAPQLARGKTMEQAALPVITTEPKYTPYREKPQIKALFNHAPAALKNCRQEVLSLLNVEVEKAGVQSGASGLSGHRFDSLLNVLKKERAMKSRTHKNLDGMREVLRHKLDSIVAESFSTWSDKQQQTALRSGGTVSAQRPPRSPEPSLPPSKLQPTVADHHLRPAPAVIAARAPVAPQQQFHSNNTSRAGPVLRQDVHADHPSGRTVPDRGHQQMEPSELATMTRGKSPTEQEDDVSSDFTESGAEDALSPLRDPQEQQTRLFGQAAPAVGKPDLGRGSARENPSIETSTGQQQAQPPTGQPTLTIRDQESESDWSDSVSELNEPPRAYGQPGITSSRPRTSHGRPPARSTNSVKQLASSLEMSLTSGKRPSGGVPLLGQPVAAGQITNIQSFRDDEDDEFSVSSYEDVSALFITK